MPKTASPYPPGWPERLRQIHRALDDCLGPVIEHGYVYYFSLQRSCLHVSIVRRDSTFAKSGDIREVDDNEMDRIIGSYGALSFVELGDKVLVFSQKRQGVTQLKECCAGADFKQGELMGLLHQHTRLAFFEATTQKSWFVS